jgi:hypothetical protein
MIIINSTSVEQEIKVIPRDYDINGVTFTLRDDSTNEITVFDNPIWTIENNYLIIYLNFSQILVENHYYDFKVYAEKEVEIIWNEENGLWNESSFYWNSGKTESIGLIYQDKIFCTNQEINQTNNKYYNLNEGQYETYDDYDNTYKVR